MRSIIAAVFSLSFLLAQVSIGGATSFNCGPYIERRACPEMVICSEPTLSRLDEIMASLYTNARRMMLDSQLAGFRDYQREWLARRTGCGCNYRCLESQYRTQIDALRKTINQVGR
jgi:uncharacterized protein